MTAPDPRRHGHRGRDQGRADASGSPRSRPAASCPGSARCSSATTPARSWYVAGKHRDCAEVGIASIREDLPADGDAGRDRGRGRPAERGPGVHRVHRPAAAARRASTPTGARAHRPRQGRRRAAPDQPRSAGAAGQRAGRRRRCRARRAASSSCSRGTGSTLRGRGRRRRRPRGRPSAGRSGCCSRGASINATVTLTHTGHATTSPSTPGNADVVIAAAGRARDHHGGHRQAGRRRPRRRRLARRRTRRRARAGVVGDVDPGVREVAAWVSPNPGGVGPMTRAMLLSNVVETAERLLG